MDRGRRFLVISLVAIGVLLVTVAGWCGPPVAPGERGPQAPGDTGQGAQAPTTAAATPGADTGFSPGGNGGPGNVSGVVGSTPVVWLEELGLGQMFIWSGRLSQELNWLTVSLDYAWASQVASQTYFGLLINPILTPGNLIDSSFNFGMWTLTGDINVFGSPDPDKEKCFGRDSYWVTGGPRLQYCNHGFTLDYFSPTVPGAGSGGDARVYSMFGLGLWGGMSLGRFVPKAVKSWCGEPGASYLDPRIIIAGTMGQGYGGDHRARYTQAEIFLKLLQVGVPRGWDRTVVPDYIVAELGYVWYKLQGQDGEPFLGGTREGRSGLTISWPCFNVTAKF